MDIVTLPLAAAFLFGGNRQVIPDITPTPVPEIPLTDVERIVNTAVAGAQQLNWQQMAFIVIVLALIALLIYVWKRPNRPAPEITAVEAMSKVVADVQRENEQQRQQHQKLIEENMTAFSDASNRMADSVDKLENGVDRLTEHIGQLVGRETARDKTLESMSSALDTMVQRGSEPLRQLIDVVNKLVEKIDKIQCGQDDLMEAVKVLAAAKEVCEQKAHDTGRLPPVAEGADASAQAENGESKQEAA